MSAYIAQRRALVHGAGTAAPTSRCARARPTPPGTRPRAARRAPRCAPRSPRARTGAGAARSSSHLDAAPRARASAVVSIRRQRRQHGGGDRLAELVAPLVRVARSPPSSRTSSPTPRRRRRSPARKRHSAPGRAALDRLAQRAWEVGVPERASGRPSASDGRRSSATTASGVPSAPSTAITDTLSSTGRSGTTRLTLMPGARPDARADPGRRSDGARPRRRRRRWSRAGRST